MYTNKDTLALNTEMFVTAMYFTVNCANNLHDHQNKNIKNKALSSYKLIQSQ